MKDLRTIKIIFLDCDGVLTDGYISYDNNRLESKNFSAHDGLGAKILSFSDIKIAVITGRKSEVLKQRCEDLNITILHQNIHNKKECAQNILDELNLKWENAAYMGDDWNDWPAMSLCHFKTAPNNAQEDLKKHVDWVSPHNGGSGAVRDLINHILKNQGIYEKCINLFLNDNSDTDFPAN